MKTIVVIGGGGHAKVVISLIKKSGSHRILGYTDFRDRGPVLGIRYLGKDDILPGLIRKKPRPTAALGIGSVLASEARNKLFLKYERLGLAFPAIVSPDAVINEDVSIGAGTVVCDGVIVNPGTKIGQGVILNTGCSIDHDCDIGDFAHLAPGVALSGGVKIGQNCLIGTGANVIQGVSIAAGATVGAGATVVEDITEPGVYTGLPARKKS